MNILEVEKNIEEMINSFSEETFIYDLLGAYGIPKASITRLKKGSLNISKNKGEIIWKKKLIFKEVGKNDLYEKIYDINNSDLLRFEPRFIIVTDYKTLLAIDTKTQDTLDIEIRNITKNYYFFLPWSGMEKAILQNENPADVKAAERMANLYDEIKKDNKCYTVEDVHNLNVFLSRLLFCFFAEDTKIFEDKLFTKSIISYTQIDGSDLDDYLEHLFELLDKENRGIIPAYLEKFPYVNGGLFRDKHKKLVFTAKSRQAIIDSGKLNWSNINPDIFGSMIQAVVNPSHRGNLGMHYTSVPNIMKVIKPLFLDELYEEFEKSKSNSNKLKKLINRLSQIRFFDPACGSGNFLIITYKEIRKLEMEIIRQLNKINLQLYMEETLITLSQFYGIELDDFAHEIATLSLWLIEHKMNSEFKKEFGNARPTLPLKASGKIIHGNATRMKWENICPNESDREVYIFGNPPYLGARVQEAEHKADLAVVFEGIKQYKNLDYISCWFYKAAQYIEGSKSKFAFVSTNSICQGEQVGLLWPILYRLNVEINFAYTSFKWVNNAKGNAGVICIIVGIENKGLKSIKRIFMGNHVRQVYNINPYLVSGKNIFAVRRNKPISKLPEMHFGNMPNDGGGLILSEHEKNQIVNEYPNSSKFFKKLIGSDEFIKGKYRWCLWITDSNLEESLLIKPIVDRIQLVRKHRLSSKDLGTNKLVERSHQFRDLNTCIRSAIIIPRVSSERREYIPIGFLDSNYIISDSAQAIYDPEPWILGLITSRIHMVWVKSVAGRLKSDYRYSKALCYNTFPFPEISDKQKNSITQYVYGILEQREKYSEKNLAELYDPEKMPNGLRVAHKKLDLFIESCYRSKPFESDEERLEYLFKIYEIMIEEEKGK